MRLINQFEYDDFFFIPHQLDTPQYKEERIKRYKERYSGHLGNMVEELFGYEPDLRIPNRYNLEVQVFRQLDYERLKNELRFYLKNRFDNYNSYDDVQLSDIFKEFEEIGKEKSKEVNDKIRF